MEDHPRTRGKHFLEQAIEKASEGSPPHTREAQIKDPFK